MRFRTGSPPRFQFFHRIEGGEVRFRIVIMKRDSDEGISVLGNDVGGRDWSRREVMQRLNSFHEISQKEAIALYPKIEGIIRQL